MEEGRQNLTSWRAPFTCEESPSSEAAANTCYMASLNCVCVVFFFLCVCHSESENQYEVVWSHDWKFVFSTGSPVTSPSSILLSPHFQNDLFGDGVAVWWGWLAKMNKNVLQMACGEVGSSVLANSAFWHEWSVSGSPMLNLFTPVLNLTKTLLISVRHHTEASMYGFFKRCTELCYAGNAS